MNLATVEVSATTLMVVGSIVFAVDLRGWYRCTRWKISYLHGQHPKVLKQRLKSRKALSCP
jgi:hypothetical protein